MKNVNYYKPVIEFKKANSGTFICSQEDFPTTLKQLATAILQYQRNEKLKYLYEKKDCKSISTTGIN